MIVNKSRWEHTNCVHIHIRLETKTRTVELTIMKFFANKLNLNLSKKLVKFCIWSIDLYGAEKCTLRKVDQEDLKVLGGSEM